jgi:hypothetical protein
MRSAQLSEDLIAKFSEAQALLISSLLRSTEQEMYQLCDYIDKEYSSSHSSSPSSCPFISSYVFITSF